MDPHHESEVTFTCDAYPLENGDIDVPTSATICMSESLLSPYDEYQYFNITVTCRKWYWQYPRLDHFDERTNHVFFNTSQHAIQQKINMILSSLEVPEGSRGAMEATILECAEKMVNISHKNRRILSMYVDIALHTWNYNDNNDNDDGAGNDDGGGDINDDLNRVVEESLEDGGLRLVPASQSSMEGLEKVEVEEQEGLCDCSICLEDFKVDYDVVRMPCMHLFHRICIVSWLHRGNFCPLCRFQMPTSDS